MIVDISWSLQKYQISNNYALYLKRRKNSQENFFDEMILMAIMYKRTVSSALHNKAKLRINIFE